LLEPIRMKVLAHDRGGILELSLEPRRGVREALLGGGEVVVGGTERLCQTRGDPPVGLPRLAPQHDEVLRGKGARLAEYGCSRARKSGKSRAMGPVFGW